MMVFGETDADRPGCPCPALEMPPWFGLKRHVAVLAASRA